ncbi:MAG: GYD domain-containing protein [Chloroflexota bacterium]|nr:GYD domain-containing protein [Chloroflexota bacterium]
MPTYVVLYRFTDQGLKNAKDTVKRAREIRKQNEERGFRVIGTYWTQGTYDLVSVVEAPDEEAMVAGLFNIAETGNVHSETLRAFTDAEMERILARG